MTMSQFHDEEKDEEKFVPKKLPQVLASSAASIGAWILGLVVSWSAPALPDIVQGLEFGELTIDNTSWIAALATLGGMISGPFAGMAMGRFGRRGALMFLAMPCLLGWIFVGFATALMSLYIGRFILGFCIGCFTIIVNVYIAEIAEDKIRGTLGFIFPISISAGVLLQYAVGAMVSWKILTYVDTIFPIALLAAMYIVPESPIYLLGLGKKKEAGKALQWLRGASSFDQIENELLQMQNFVEENAGRKISFKDFFAPSVMKPTLIAMGLMVFQQFSGVNIILFYTVDIFKATGSDIDPSLATIIVGIVVLLSCCVSAPFIDRAGRRILLVISGAGMSLSLASMGYFFYQKELNDNQTPESLGWLPLASLMAFIISLNWGYGPIPWVMLGELIPNHVKGTAATIVMTINWFLCFLIVKTFEDMTIQLGTYGAYWLFSFFCFVAIFFGYFIVPETRGKTLEDIQKLFDPPKIIQGLNSKSHHQENGKFNDEETDTTKDTF